MPRRACHPFRVDTNVMTMLVALSATIVAVAKAETAGNDVGVVDGGRAPKGGGWSDEEVSTTSSAEEVARPSVALIFDVSGVNDGYAERAALWQGVAHALSAEGKERVTVLLATDENVSRRTTLTVFGFFFLFPSSSLMFYALAARLPLFEPSSPSPLSCKTLSPLLHNRQDDKGDIILAAARETAKDWPGVDVQRLPPTTTPISAPKGVAVSYRTFLWLRERECLPPQLGNHISSSITSSQHRQQNLQRAHPDSRARRRGALAPGEAPCVATALFHDWGGVGYFATVAKRQGVALSETQLVILMSGPRHWRATRAGGGGAMTNLAGLEAAFMERGGEKRVALGSLLVAFFSCQGTSRAASFFFLSFPLFCFVFGNCQRDDTG